MNLRSCITCFLLPLLTTAAGTGYAQQQPAEQPPAIVMQLLPQNNTPYQDTGTISRLIDTALIINRTSPDSARTLLHIALRASEQLRFTRGTVKSLTAIGSTDLDKGNYLQALEIYRRAVAACGRDTSLRFQLINLYNNTGNTYRYLGDYSKAVSFYNLALQHLKDSSGETFDVIRARTFNNLSAVLMDMREDDKAEHYIQQAEILLRRYHNDRSLGRLLNNKGGVLIRKNQLQESAVVLHEALALSIRAKDLETQNLALNNLAVICRTRKETVKAIRYLEEAIRISGTINPFLQVNPYLSLGQIYLDQKDYTHAEEQLLKALAIGMRAGLPAQMARTHRLLADVYSAKGDYRNAWEQEHQYNILHDSLLKEEKTRSINTIEARFRSAEKDKEIAQARTLLRLRQQAHRQQQKIWLFAGIGALLLLAGLFTLLFIHIRNKQRMLSGKMQLLEQEQEIRLLRAHMDGEEKERGRIGRELHDGIGGLLSAAKIRMSTMRLNNKSLSHEKDFNSALVLIDDANTELRKTAHNLLPEVILKGGLPDAIRNFSNHMAQGTDTHIHLQSYGAMPRLDMAIELSLYRIIQELINNIIKHANAGQALIQLNWQEDFFSVSVEDDGTGFAVAEAQAKASGIGLQNIIARVKALDGTVEFESAPDTGTSVYMEFNSLKLKHTISVKHASYYRRHSR